METLIAKHDGDLPERAFSLFKAEPIEADPDYARKTDLEHLTIEDFYDRFLEAGF